MATITGVDGKLHYMKDNKIKSGYSDYWDWYDHGPGSESFKRELRESMGPPLKEFPDLKGFPFHQPFETEKSKENPIKMTPWKKAVARQVLGYEKLKKDKEYITDKDLEIDV